MFIRAYLRASTKEQDDRRAKSELIAFAKDHGHKIAAFYVENESGATLVRPKLMQHHCPLDRLLFLKLFFRAVTA